MKNRIAQSTTYGTLKSAQHVIKGTILKTDVKMTQTLDKEPLPQAEKILTDTTTKKTDKYV